MIPHTPGTYILALHLARTRCIRIGRLGTLAFQPGIYLYVGSAFGPGGLHARIAHHLKKARRPHWHVDYLRRHAKVAGVWYAEGRRVECRWARKMSRWESAFPIEGFGCSDCCCASHLIRLEGDVPLNLDLPCTGKLTRLA
jgi:Uri superfamily endonuclease